MTTQYSERREKQKDEDGKCETCIWDRSWRSYDVRSEVGNNMKVGGGQREIQSIYDAVDARGLSKPFLIEKRVSRSRKNETD